MSERRRFHPRSVMRGLAVAVVGTLVAAGVVIGASSVAVAADEPGSFTCDVGTIYGVVPDQHGVNAYELGTGQPAVSKGAFTPTVPVPANGRILINALALPGEGPFIYAMQNVFNAGSTTNNVGHNTILRLNTATGVTESFAGTPTVTTSTNFFGGGIDLATGIYYYAATNGAQLDVYAFDTTTNTAIPGRVARVPIPVGTVAAGDLAFDAAGVMYFVTRASGAATEGALRRVVGDLPTTGADAALSSAVVAQYTGLAGSVFGAAFDGQDLIVGNNATNLLRVNPSNGEAIGNETVAESAGDFASCSLPDTMRVVKDVPVRNAATDQFTVTISGGSLGAPASGTTTGTEAGVQDQVDEESAGTVFGRAGETYTIAETAAGTTDLADYVSSWSCVETVTDAEIAAGTGTTGTFQLPAANGQNIECRFLNVLAAPALTLEKSSADASFAAVGDVLDYSFLVSNTGNVSVSTLVVADEKLDAVAVCPVTVLAPGASTTCTGVHTVVQADVDAGSVVNVASVSGVDPSGDPVVSPEDSVTVPGPVAAPVLMLEKSADQPTDENGNGRLDAGDTIQYRFVVANAGNVSVTSIVVDDPLIGDSTCEETILAPGDDTECVADALYVITEADVQAGVVLNTATAAGIAPGGSAVLSAADSTSTPTNGAAPAPSPVVDPPAAVSPALAGTGVDPAILVLVPLGMLAIVAGSGLVGARRRTTR